MKFHINADKMLSLKEFITRKIKGQIQFQYFDFTALENISFEVRRGENLGIFAQTLCRDIKTYAEFDNIIEFSGLKNFINVPIRNYSSGMSTRFCFYGEAGNFDY